MHYQARQREVRRALAASRAQAFFISEPHNVAYLTGFDSTNGFVLLTADETVVLTDFRYETALCEIANVHGYTLIIAGQGLMPTLRACCKARGLTRLAYEPGHLTVAQFKRLSKGMRSITWVAAGDWVMQARIRKDDDEIACMRRAIRVAEEGFVSVKSRRWIGLREDDAAELLEHRMQAVARRHGWHAACAFPIIVAAGVHAAVPHHHPGSATIHEGMMVTFDWGARIDGYCSDMTRTVYMGTPDAQFRKVYRTVLRAQRAAIRAYRSGVALKTVDTAARTVISRAGYGKYFRHGTGHGIGREVHEGFSASPNGKGRIKRGMVCTVEPGIYIPDWGGVRIEDMVVTTPRGTEVMTALAK
jgi:Xaa-Pro aminopeptidase